MELSTRIAFLAFYVAFIVQILFWLLIWSRVLFYKPVRPRTRKTPVSVIICARNEEENLRKNLPLIL
jgi:hypothetical protein